MSKFGNLTLVTIAAGFFLLLDSSTPPNAAAEEVTTTKKVRVMKRPGEKSAVVTRIQAGESMTVLAKRGRWIKVRVNGRTGWITRTSVGAKKAQARTDVSKTRRRPFVDGRSKRRGWSGEAPDDRVGADAVDEELIDEDTPAKKTKTKTRAAAKAEKAKKAKAKKVASFDDDEEDLDEDADEDADEDEDADADSDEKTRTVLVTADEAEMRSKPSTKGRSVSVAEQGSELMVIRESDSGKWLLVENDEGDAGWVRSSEVGSSKFTYPKSMKRGSARIGYATVSQTFASDGVGELANYTISSAAASVAANGDFVYTYSPQYMLRFDVAYVGTRATPGIRFQNAAGEAADIAFTHHDINGGAAVGYNMKSDNGMVVYGRAGYHYSKLGIHDVEDFAKNLAYLPSEILSGITVGAHVDVPRLNKKWGVNLGADMLYNGKRVQTAGLEDGAVSTSTAIWGGALATYQWKPDMVINIGYRYSYAKTEWTGAVTESMRPHNATEAARKDVGHNVSIGVGKTF